MVASAVNSCKDCAGCPLKEKCIRACGSKKPLAERSKVIYVSKRFAGRRAEMKECVNTNEEKDYFGQSSETEVLPKQPI